MEKEKLALLREKIDHLDTAIARLIGERADIARDIGKTKGGAPVYDPARENRVIEKVIGESPDLDKEGLTRIYRELISLCRSVQYRPRAAFLGPEGSFSHEGVLQAFGGAVDLVPCSSFPEIFSAVDKGAAQWGVLPAENSLEGTVLPTMDAFVAAGSEIVIHNEISIDVSHVLASEEKTMNSIKKVLSHPQALGQCREWLRTNLPWAEQIPAGSTSAAAAACGGNGGSAAICSVLAAERTGLNVLAEKIQDRGGNRTRFWVVGKGTPGRGERNKTSFLFNVEHRPGRLFYALEPLYENGLNLTHIQSRPLSGSPFEYYFFIDVEGFIGDEPVRKALEAMRERTVFLRILGSYPCR